MIVVDQRHSQIGRPLPDLRQQFAQLPAFLGGNGARIRFQLVDHLKVKAARIANKFRIGGMFGNRIGFCCRVDGNLAAG
jgi:hypothetical protein